MSKKLKIVPKYETGDKVSYIAYDGRKIASVIDCTYQNSKEVYYVIRVTALKDRIYPKNDILTTTIEYLKKR